VGETGVERDGQPCGEGGAQERATGEGHAGLNGGGGGFPSGGP
jgi:hypothetical protein